VKKQIHLLTSIFVFMLVLAGFVYAADYVEFSQAYLDAKGIAPNETYPVKYATIDTSGKLQTSIREYRYSSRLYEDEIPDEFRNYTLVEYRQYLENKTLSENSQYSGSRILSFFDPITGESIPAEDNPFLLSNVPCTPSCNEYYDLTNYYCDATYCYATCMRTAGCKGDWEYEGKDSEEVDDYDDDRIIGIDAIFDPDEENDYCSNDACYTDYCYKVEIRVRAGIADCSGSGCEPKPDETDICITVDVDEDITEFGSYYDVMDDCDPYYYDDFGYTRTIDEDNVYIYPYNYGSVSNDQGYFDKTWGDERFDGTIDYEQVWDWTFGDIRAEFYSKEWYDADSYNTQCTKPDCNVDSDCSGTKPYCLNQVCVQCKQDSHCTYVCSSNNNCIRCKQNTDCGINGWRDIPTCNNNDVYDYYRTYTCNNPDTASASCSAPNDNFQFKTDCGEDTPGPWGPNYCSDGNVVHTRTIYTAGCSGPSGSAACYTDEEQDTQIVETCTYGCSNNGGPHCVVPECIDDSGCSADGWTGELVCNADGNLWQNWVDWSCQNPATESAACVDSYESKLKASCDWGCLIEPGNDICDPNIPPNIDEFTAEVLVYRTNTSVLTCKGTDPNGNSELNSAAIQYKAPSGSWQDLTATKQGISGGKVVFTADFIPAPAAELGTYDLQCKVTDDGGKSSDWKSITIDVEDYPTEFTFPGVQDHSSFENPTLAGEWINFTANLYDPDSVAAPIKLVICDDAGLNGLSCANQQYCYDGYKPHGAFLCTYDSTGYSTGSYDWTSYAINFIDDVIAGNTGTFYTINQPLNPEIFFDSIPLWNYNGYYEGTETISFKEPLINALNACTPDADDFCLLPFTIETYSGGLFKLSDLRIRYALYDNEAPQLHPVQNIIVNEGDLVTITPTAYDPNGDVVAFTISEPVGDDGIWQTGEDDDGEYVISITASDGWLTDSIDITLKVLELIDPGAGGVVRYKDVTIIVPPGALPENNFTAIEVSEMNEDDYVQENNLRIAGKVYRFEPSGMVFDPPLQIEIEYNESEIDDEDSIDAFLYKLIDEVHQVYTWVPLGAEVDKENNLLKFNLTHFSDYAICEIMGDTTPPTITIDFPKEQSYWHDTGVRSVDYAVFDSRDYFPTVTITLDSQVIDEVIDFGALSAGNHTLTIEAVDKFGNSDSRSVTFGITDYETPETIVDIDYGWVNHGVNITLEASDDSGDVTTYYCVDNYGTCNPAINGREVFINESGVHYLRYYSVDAAGNQETWKTALIKIDKINPMTTAQSISGWQKHDVEINLEASDSLSGVNKTFYKINDGSWIEGKVISIQDEGFYNVSYYSVDNTGNQEEINELPEFSIDKTDPVTTASFDSEWSNHSQNITFACDDSFSGCKRIDYCMTKSGSISCGAIADNLLSFDCPENRAFEAVVRYQGIDNAGNNEELKEAVVRIDKKVPVINILEPSSDVYIFEGTLTIDFEILEDSGIDSFTALFDNEPVENGYVIDLETIEFGEHNLTITAIDMLGHYSEKTASFDMVNAKPILQDFDDMLFDESEIIRIEPRFMDPDDPDLDISFSAPLDSSGKWQTGYHDAGVYPVTIAVTDGHSGDSKSFTITIRDVNQRPTINVDKDYYMIRQGENLSFNLIADDIDMVDGDSLTYSSNRDDVTVNQINETFLEVTWTPTNDDVGGNGLKFTVTDSKGLSASKIIGVTVVNVNDQPSLVAYPIIPDPKARVNSSKTFSVDASDPDNDELGIRWYVDGEEIADASDSEFVYTPTELGEHTIKVDVSDALSSASHSWNVAVTDNFLLSTFDGATTKSILGMTDEQLISVTNFILEKTSQGKIDFSEPLDLTESIDFDNCVVVDSPIIAVDTGCLPGLQGSSARITANGLSYNKTPVIYYYDGFTTDTSMIMQPCTLCTVVDYTPPPTTDGTVVFDVSHFSTFLISFITEHTPDLEQLTVSTLGYILNVDARIDGDKESNLEDGDKLTAKPGDELKFYIGLENIGILDLDVEAEAKIDNIAGKDLDEDADFGVKAGRSKEEDLKFTIPSNAEEDDYDVELDIEIKDEEGNEYNEELELELEVERERHKLELIDVSLSKVSLRCDRNVNLEIEVVNLGSKKEDVKLVVSSDELGISEQDSFEADTDYDDVYERIIPLTIDKEIPAGTYSIDVEAYYDDKLGDKESIKVVLKGCTETKTTEQTQIVEAAPIVPVKNAMPPVYVGSQNEVVDDKDEGIQLFLLVEAFILLLITVSYMLWYVLFKV